MSRRSISRPGTDAAGAGPSFLMAAAMTLGLFVLLPLIEGRRVAPPDVLVRPAFETRPPPPPAPPPPPPAAEETVSAPSRVARVAPPRLTPVLRWAPTPLPLEATAGTVPVAGLARVPVFLEAPASTVFEVRQLDTPPRPRVRPSPVYPARARASGVEGDVVVQFVVRADGEVEGVDVVAANPGDLFVEAAVRAVRRWRFEPGMIEGRPVPVRVRQRLVFRLDEGEGR